jgi:hypothetical protein
MRPPGDAQALEVGRLVLRIAILLGLTGDALGDYRQNRLPPDCPSRDAFLRRHRLHVKARTSGWTTRGKTRSVTAVRRRGCRGLKTGGRLDEATLVRIARRHGIDVPESQYI